MWYASYGSKKLNLNRRGRFNLSLSDMYSVYTFVSMLQKTLGPFSKHMECLIFLTVVLWCYKSTRQSVCKGCPLSWEHGVHPHQNFITLRKTFLSLTSLLRKVLCWYQAWLYYTLKHEVLSEICTWAGNTPPLCSSVQWQFSQVKYHLNCHMDIQIFWPWL